MWVPSDPPALVPMEDTIEALVEYLLSPLLPISVCKSLNPTEYAQKMVANQMHAVMILYSYYHRKHFPKLEALGFESFCKICCIAKPQLLMYMRYMLIYEEGSENFDSQLSITEKMVKDACNICVGLDSSKDTPDMEGWPVSKVAIFLVDTKKERCLLQHSSITQGVYSLVEKDLEACYERTGVEHASEGKTLCPSSRNGSCGSEDVLEQLAFSAVEQETGISRSDLIILEHRLTYSLSREKTTTRLYIITYGRVGREDMADVPIKDLIRSLEGPIVKRVVDSEVAITSFRRGLGPQAEVTTVVEYCNLLPYIEFISNWLSRQDNAGDPLDLPPQQIMNSRKCTSGIDSVPSLEVHKITEISANFEQNGNCLHLVGQQVINGMKCTSEMDTVPLVEGHEVNKNTVPNNQKMDINNRKLNKRASETKQTNGYGTFLDSNQRLVSDILPAVEVSDLNGQNINRRSNKVGRTEIVEKNADDLPSVIGSSSGFMHNKTDVSQIGTECLISTKDHTKCVKFLHNEQSTDVNHKNSIENANTSNKIGGPSQNGLTAAVNSCKGDTSSLNPQWQLSFGEDSSERNVISNSYIDKRKMPVDNRLAVYADGSNNKAGPVDTMCCSTKCTTEERTNSNSPQEAGSASRDLPLVHLQFKSDEQTTLCHKMESKENDLLQASLRVLQRRRDELIQKQRLLEDEIARCELNIHIIMNEDDENFPSKVESVIEALNSFCPSLAQTSVDLPSEEDNFSQAIKRRKLSEAILTSRSSCQELDDKCHRNSWMLPKYRVLLPIADCKITGRFRATVTIVGSDFEFTSEGDLKSSPREARDSAAAHMLSKLRRMSGLDQFS